MAAIDCDRLCKNFDMGGGPEWFDDASTVQDCVRLLGLCNGDADCGIGDLCILFGGHVDGYAGGCSEQGSACNEDGDCLQGSRCIAFDMRSDPETGALVPYGVCSTGEDNQACLVDDDCVAPNQCVKQNLDTFVTSSARRERTASPVSATTTASAPTSALPQPLGA